MKKKILIVDDEWNMRNLLKIYLKDEFHVIEADDGGTALSLIYAEHFDLIILDIMLPNIDGWKICKEIRKEKNTPILMLTARNELKDKVYGLGIGADDYLGKPFEPDELVARVKSLLRRSFMNENHLENVLVFGEQLLIIKTDSRIVFVKGEKLDLTPKEYDVFYLLAKQPHRLFTRDVLLDVVWGLKDIKDVRTVDTHIKNIRIKVKQKIPTYNPIKTVWGLGYRFDPVDEE
ncbi:response regulator transcription factor (plasmid) [Priestia megaterium]|uniref:response regulator transcription factor n=1 Tax=Priestia TaxID=2800373 RepID=UPI00196B792C|nr:MULTISPECIES: response regulator transcription factor [Priestia]MCW1048950.1 response regulator transcription factor [Priestia sp. JV24]QSF42171.1 response regulator transcription factor [Priestia megaterium]